MAVSLFIEGKLIAGDPQREKTKKLMVDLLWLSVITLHSRHDRNQEDVKEKRMDFGTS